MGGRGETVKEGDTPLPAHAARRSQQAFGGDAKQGWGRVCVAGVPGRLCTCSVERAPMRRALGQSGRLALWLLMPASTAGRGCVGLAMFPGAPAVTVYGCFLSASLSRPQSGQMEPVEGKRQTALLGQPRLPAGPTPAADMSATARSHTNTHTLREQPAKTTRNRGAVQHRTTWKHTDE